VSLLCCGAGTLIHCLLIRGLKFVSKDRAIRIRAIADEIASSQYDIVALQELWVQSDFDHVKARVAQRLPYSKYFLR
jgi:sphingomyelin phosphodiesterase 2